jgi:hypothetical protein
VRPARNGIGFRPLCQGLFDTLASRPIAGQVAAHHGNLAAGLQYRNTHINTMPDFVFSRHATLLWSAKAEISIKARLIDNLFMC